MRIVCAWCGADLGTRPSDVHPEWLISHGLCRECERTLFSQFTVPMYEYLDRINAPVAVVKADGSVVAANTQAREMLHKEKADIDGQPGDVFECAYAKLPEGCGHTVHCNGCTIRRTVMDTFESGRSHRRESVTLNSDTPDGVTGVPLLISTEKVGDVVLLRVDSVGGG
jgi:hypothetical protein